MSYINSFPPVLVMASDTAAVVAKVTVLIVVNIYKYIFVDVF